MLAIYRNSLHMKTPTPLRERMGRWLPMDLRAGQEPPSACPTTGHVQQSQYDFSDSFIASGILVQWHLCPGRDSGFPPAAHA